MTQDAYQGRMAYLKNRSGAFLTDESGGTAIEYAVLGAGIAVAIATVVGTIGSSLLPKYQQVNDGFQALQGGG
ncbi:Flp family type IVb pilin [Tepidamorphus sp. 3E244]|uniref:Flp family type IVb pilin n=1 Tax=Tepidamorphus sp. 3E244 TaxID=3385498 RepID=UPI0038FD0A66